MGSLADFLKQRELDAMVRDDSHTGTTTPHGRPGTLIDTMGCENGRAAPESRDSQGVAHSPCMDLLDVVSGRPRHSHAFAKQRDDSQVCVAERPGTHGASCDAVGHANRRQSAESRDSQGCEGVRTMLTTIARNEGRPSSTRSICATWAHARACQRLRSALTCVPCTGRGRWLQTTCRPAGRTSRAAPVAALSGCRPRCRRPSAHARGASIDATDATRRRRIPDRPFRAVHDMRAAFNPSPWITLDALGLRAVARLLVPGERTMLISVGYSVQRCAVAGRRVLFN